jgi:hypothetical protein
MLPYLKTQQKPITHEEVVSAQGAAVGATVVGIRRSFGG